MSSLPTKSSCSFVCFGAVFPLSAYVLSISASHDFNRYSLLLHKKGEKINSYSLFLCPPKRINKKWIKVVGSRSVSGMMCIFSILFWIVNYVYGLNTKKNFKNHCIFTTILEINSASPSYYYPFSEFFWLNSVIFKYQNTVVSDTLLFHMWVNSFVHSPWSRSPVLSSLKPYMPHCPHFKSTSTLPLFTI